jgi:hypothetical protein
MLFSIGKGALSGAFFSWKRLVWQPAFYRLLRRWRINDRYVEDLFDDLLWTWSSGPLHFCVGAGECAFDLFNRSGSVGHDTQQLPWKAGGSPALLYQLSVGPKDNPLRETYRYCHF